VILSISQINTQNHNDDRRIGMHPVATNPTIIVDHVVHAPETNAQIELLQHENRRQEPRKS
jgi:hypothetical protein